MPKDKRRVRDSGENLPSRKRKGPGDTDKSSHVTGRITRRMTTDAARDAVLYTAELLEQIFEYLPPRSILTAQRVCAQFRSIVARSEELQNKMLGKDESAVEEKWIMEHFPGNMGGGRFFHRLNQEALDFMARQRPYPTYTVITPNELIFRPFLPEMTEAEHVDEVRSNYGGDVFQLAPRLKSALLESRTDQKNSWQDMQLCTPSRYTQIDIHANIRVGPWSLEFRNCIIKDLPRTLRGVLQETLNCREKREYRRHAWAYLYDGNPESLVYFTQNHFPYIPYTTTLPLGSQSLEEVIAEKEQEYGVNAVMDVAPSISLWHCVQPSESVKNDVRTRGSEDYVMAKLKEGPSTVAGMPVGHPGGNWFY